MTPLPERQFSSRIASSNLIRQSINSLFFVFCVLSAPTFSSIPSCPFLLLSCHLLSSSRCSIFLSILSSPVFFGSPCFAPVFSSLSLSLYSFFHPVRPPELDRPSFSLTHGIPPPRLVHRNPPFLLYSVVRRREGAGSPLSPFPFFLLSFLPIPSPRHYPLSLAFGAPARQ